MPKFFIPLAESSEQAERLYAMFAAQNQYPALPGRLCRIKFRFRDKPLIAEVGKEISGFPEYAGPVLAIVAATELVTIHTQLRGGLSASPILVSPDEVTECVYFDDLPAQP